MEWQKSEFTISDNSDKLNVNWVVSCLRQTYWGCNRSEEIIASSFRKSLCFGLYCGEHQIGFARVVTDDYTFAWLCDVYIDEEYRGQGLGTWLVATVLEHPVVKRIGLKILGTLDAHGLYQKFGFVPANERFMVKRGT
jgi:GNAT superfamily N-acetyltransferase